MSWTVVVFVVISLRALSASTDPLATISRALWIAPFGGAILGTLLSVLHWVSPLKVESGPRGILRSKGEAHALIPWNAIESYRIYRREGESVLELRVSYATEPERLYLPLRTDLAKVEDELCKNIRTVA